MKFSVVATLTGLVLGVGGALYRVAPTSYIAWFLVVSTLIIVSLYVAHLLVSRNELRERAEYNRQLLQRYSAEINERMTSFWRVESWNKKIVIHDNGDVTETSIVEATAAAANSASSACGLPPASSSRSPTPLDRASTCKREAPC